YNGAPVVVSIGYDRPLDYVFLTVWSAGDEDAVYYSNLDDEYAGIDCDDVDYYRRILAEMHIEVPISMFEETLRDQAMCVGNRVVEHSLT
ncbi:hypothetical protein ACHRB9_19465, partial [Acinetobacter baumannii]|uniref:hypothetical protein n=1 Tax=Acinetobacter baumannii TaxID=470 RepID=UPI0037565876